MSNKRVPGKGNTSLTETDTESCLIAGMVSGANDTVMSHPPNCVIQGTYHFTNHTEVTYVTYT